MAAKPKLKVICSVPNRGFKSEVKDEGESWLITGFLTGVGGRKITDVAFRIPKGINTVALYARGESHLSLVEIKRVWRLNLWPLGWKTTKRFWEEIPSDSPDMSPEWRQRRELEF